MKGKLYTMLRIKREYELSLFEYALWLLVKDTGREEYIHYLIELRDGGHIKEKNKEQPIDKRLHYLTRKGYDYLPKVKTMYLNQLKKKALKWIAVTVISSFAVYFLSLTWKYLFED